MLRERPVARLSAALEGTKPNSSAAAETFSCVRRETEPRPDSALDAVDFETPASLATSASVLTRLTLVRKLAEDGGFEPPRAFTQDAFQACNVGKQLDSQISCEIGPLVELQALPAGNWNVPVIHSRDIFVNLSVTGAFEAILDCRPIPTEIVLYRNGIEPIPGEIKRPQ